MTKNDIRNNCFLLIIIALAIVKSSQTSFELTPQSRFINDITNYTWEITFTSNDTRTQLTLNFPSSVTVQTNNVSVLSPATAVSITSSSQTQIILDISSLSITTNAKISITIANIANPSFKTTTNLFSISTSVDSTINLASTFAIQFLAGILQSCEWNFNGTTEEVSSDLTISVVTSNPIPVGSNKIIISYGDYIDKDLLTAVSSGSISCSSTSIPSGLGCIADISSSIITASYSISNSIAAGTTISITINGVNNPPTKSTSTDSDYAVTTYNSNNKIIDTISNCNINDVEVTTDNSTGVWSNTSLTINSDYSSSFITFGPSHITFKSGDQMIMTHNLDSSLVCGGGNFLVQRDSSSPIFTTFFSGTTTRTYTLDSGDILFSNNIILYLDCVIPVPSSQSPQIFTFTFQRTNSPYLILETTLTAIATVIDSVNANLSPTTTEMGQNADYTFTILTSQPLGTAPKISFTLNSNIDFSLFSNSCQVSIGGSQVSSSSVSCQQSSSVLSVSFISTIIGANTSIVIVANSLINPLTPEPQNYDVNTYYNSSESLSLVENGPSVIQSSFTVRNIDCTLTPSIFTVQTSTGITITFQNEILLASNTQFSIVFPSEVGTISLASTDPLKLNGNGSSISSQNIDDTTKTVTFITDDSISIGDTVSIDLTIISPSYIASFNSLQLTITRNNYIYQQSLNTMSFSVDTLSSEMSVSIQPSDLKTGVSNAYSFDLTLPVSHPSTFLLYIYFPSGSYSHASGSCTSPCVSISDQISYVKVTMNNISSSLNIIIGNFSNSRTVGLSQNWNFTTFTSTGQGISTCQAQADITTANTLSSSFSSDYQYYKENIEDVRFTLTVNNKFQNGDTIIMEIPTDIYTFTGSNNTICSTQFANCEYKNTTSNVMSIVISPNELVANNSLSISLADLTSGNGVLGNINFIYKDIAGILIQTGTMSYTLSCTFSPASQRLCQQCTTDGNCTSCYDGFYISNLTCISECGAPSSYLQYNNNNTGTCTICENDCLTCTTDINCITCQQNFYYFPQNSTCRSTCSSSGYVIYTFNNKSSCGSCFDSDCQICNDTNSGSCTSCNTTILDSGVCVQSCTNLNYFVFNNQCLACDDSCSSCTGATNADCVSCKTSSSYYNSSGYCVNSCPTGTAFLADFTCGCDSNCNTCQTSTSTYCLACTNTSLFSYNGNCISQCPSSTYQNGNQCIACSTACSNCTINTCLQCSGIYSLYQNNCYSDCNSVSQQYDSSGGICILCPDGCDQCSGSVCSVCLSGYSLQGSSCISTCSQTNTCVVQPEQLVPLPGLITVVVWVVIVMIAKFFLPQTYVPYSLIFLSSLIQFALIIACLGVGSSLETSRLLVADYGQRETVVILLAVSLAINYILNILYLIIFMKYIKPLVEKPTQMDYISNTVVLILCTLTNFRFGLIAFSKMVPKPSIFLSQINSLTPIHILCVISIIFDVIPLAACGIIIQNQDNLSIIFMLGVDLLIVIIINTAITIWFLVFSKDDLYYQSNIRKTYIEENYRTHEQINEKEISKAKINPSFSDSDDLTMKRQQAIDNSYLIASKIGYDSGSKFQNNRNNNSSDPEGINASVINIRTSNFKTDQETDLQNNINKSPKTKNQSPKAIKINTIAEVDQNFEKSRSNLHDFNPIEKEWGMRDYEGPIDEDEGLKRKVRNTNLVVTNLNPKENMPIESIEEDNSDFSNQIPQMQEKSVNEKKKVGSKSINVFQHQEKIKPKRVEKQDQKKIKNKRGVVRQNQSKKNRYDNKEKQSSEAQMKKNKKIGYFQSDYFDEHSSDFDQKLREKIAQSVIRMPKTKEKKNFETNSQEGNEQVSPSWFNFQNQRFDIDESDA